MKNNPVISRARQRTTINTTTEKLREREEVCIPAPALDFSRCSCLSKGTFCPARARRQSSGALGNTGPGPKKTPCAPASSQTQLLGRLRSNQQPGSEVLASLFPALGMILSPGIKRSSTAPNKYVCRGVIYLSGKTWKFPNPLKYPLPGSKQSITCQLGNVFVCSPPYIFCFSL